MDNLFTAVILSIVEGLTEFLPVSSSGHLILVGDLLNFMGEKAATFEVVIQLGAIMAVVVLYWKRFWGLVRPQPYVRFAGMRGIMLLILTSLPASVLGLLLHSTIKTYLFRPLTVLIALVVGAVMMIVVERRKFKPSYITLDDMTPKLALGIGCFQCLALWPGFSRSASTIMGGMLLGGKRS
ncbi:MAG: undecaprenyl-diphosphate phosphatase, partial [Desulfovibrio sp.]